jgi:hypothetical protein
MLPLFTIRVQEERQSIKVQKKFLQLLSGIFQKEGTKENRK